MTCFGFILSTTGLNCSLRLFYYWILCIRYIYMCLVFTFIYLWYLKQLDTHNTWPVTIKHVPTHLGKGALHILRPPPRQINSGEPSRRYPILQEKDKVSPTPKL